MYLNKVFVYGNLTRDPELKALPGGSNVCNFSVATNRVFTGKDGKKQEQAEFHSIVAFGRQAEIIAQYLRKGSTILVEGRIQTRSWDKAGVKQYRTEIVVENMQLGPRSAGGSTGGGDRPSAPNRAPANEPQEEGPSGPGIDYPKDEVNPDDIPF
jgi:single-strand DNA-binding protein